jgi:hypothetical protein
MAVRQVAWVRPRPFSPMQTVGRESEAHPAFPIIPSTDAEHHLLLPLKVINTASYVMVKA